MKLRWPPSRLGLGTPLNLALLSSGTRATAKRDWWLPIVLGVVLPLVMLGLDQLFFDGSSLERVRELGSEPLTLRLLIVPYSAIREEFFYRVGAATLSAWLAFLILSRQTEKGKNISHWIGILVAAVLFGLAHVATLPDAAHPVLRAVVVNGVPAIALGWLYWWRGLESAILMHMVAIAVVYIAVPPFI